MNYVGKLFSSFKTFYSELNPATLTGAIDVLVVEQEDGSLVCSPFHVRFGKMGVLRSREKVVWIEVNGEPIDLCMKLGENGEAFFVEETEKEDHVPAHLATSPIPSNIDIMQKGLKHLHAEARKSEVRPTRSETDSSKESDVGKQERSEDFSDIACEKVKANSKLTSAIQELTYKDKLTPVAITIEDKKIINKDSNVPKIGARNFAQQDIDVGNVSSQDEDMHISAKVRIADSAKMTEDILCKESEVRPGRKGRGRRRKRRNEARTTSKTDRPDIGGREIRRAVHLSESSTSSSQHSDDDEIFQMEDFKEEEEEDHRLPRYNYRGMDEVTPEEWKDLLDVTPGRNFHPLSDGDATPLLSPEGTRPPTPKSDTELENVRHKEYKNHMKPLSNSISTDKIEWNWGELPESPHEAKHKDIEKGEDDLDASKQASARKSLWNKFNFVQNIKHSQGTEQGMYLADLASEEVDPEVYALYFPESSVQVPTNRIRTIRDVKDDDKSSDLGASLPQSPNSVSSISPGSVEMNHDDVGDNVPMDVHISLCGGLKEDEDTVPLDLFNKHEITYEGFCKDPNILSNPNVVLRIGDKFYNWQTAGPIIMSWIVFQRPLPEMVVSGLVKEHMPKNKRSLITSWLWGGSSTRQNTPKKESGIGEETAHAEDKEVNRARDETAYWSDDMMEHTRERSDERSDERSGAETPPSKEIYKKTIRLSSDQLSKLMLKPGPNEITYSVTTRYQGTALCQSTIYLWKYDSKIIVSDIDGTITKSDVMGHILPVLGKDWTHPGVANLYSSMKHNGYEFLFLSSRAIGQARHTKGYLKSVVQDKMSLPDGPLLLNPSSLIRAFHSEVIVRKPEEFKIKCLQDIQSLFPNQDEYGNTTSPFYAGFGNRINDTWAYRAVGIPVSRIFTINPQGKVTHDLTWTFQSSYPKLTDLVDHVFPSIHRKRTAFEAPYEYSSFTFWRTPLPNITVDDPLLVEMKQKKIGEQK